MADLDRRFDEAAQPRQRLAARNELAHELHYSGSTGDSAAMNVRLHKQVMIKLAENGGKVPEALKH